MTRARKQPLADLEERCPGGDPGRCAVRGSAQAGAAANKQPRTRLERWDERFVVALAFALAAIIAVMTIYQTIVWARS